MADEKKKTWLIWIIAAACVLVAMIVSITINTPKTEDALKPIDIEEPPVETEVTEPENTVSSEETDEVEDDDLPVGLVARRIDDGSNESSSVSEDSEPSEKRSTWLDDSDYSEEAKQWFLDSYKELYPDWDPLAIYDFDPDAGFSEADIEDIVTVLSISFFSTSDSYADIYKGYRTESTHLEAAGPFPWYYLTEDGKLGESPSEFCIIFDDGEPVFLIIKSRVGRTYHQPLDTIGENLKVLSLEGRPWNGHYTTSLKARIESGSTEFAFISGDDMTLLVDGDELYETNFVAYNEGEHPIFYTEYIGWESLRDPSYGWSNRDPKDVCPVDLTGLELGSLNNRQTFEYQSPED